MAHGHTRMVMHPDGLGVGCADGEFAIVSAGSSFALVLTESVEEYRAALARIADAINQHLDATAPTPEPIKVGDVVTLKNGALGHWHVRRVVDDGKLLVVQHGDHGHRWVAPGYVTKVPS